MTYRHMQFIPIYILLFFNSCDIFKHKVREIVYYANIIQSHYINVFNGREDVEMSDRNDTLISIVIPVYNAAPYLPKTLQSIAEQTYPDWELILVDDASTDGSVFLIKKWIESQNKVKPKTAGQIRLIELNENKGPAAARNIGIKAAQGRYLVYLDADDYWAKDKLEKQYFFAKRYNYAFTFTGYEFAGRTVCRNRKIVHVPKKISYHKALTNTTISTITVMFDRTQIPDELLMMPENCRREDTATWWKILKNGYDAYGLDEALSVYLRHSGSHSANKLQAVKGTWEMYREQEKLSFGKTVYCMTVNILRAVKRRI